MEPSSAIPPCEELSIPSAASENNEQTFAALAENLESMLEAARPRLLSLARLQGVTSEAVEDIAQETLLIAWRRLESLRSPERFDSWLDGICRNLCRMQARSTSATRARQVMREGGARPEFGAPFPSLLDIADPLAQDPGDILDRQDLATLLDQAIGYLPESAREAVELRYLRELPERDVALRLGITIGALEVQLHRARRRMRQVLSGALRAEAEVFGLLPDDELPDGWRETREWCHLCGRRRLRGVFEAMADGRVNFRLRCPECSTRYQADMHDSAGFVQFDGVRSIRPAFKRTLLGVNARYAEALITGELACSRCGALVRPRVAQPNEPGAPFPQQRSVALECLRCGFFHSVWLGGLTCLADPSVRPLIMRFLLDHPRWVMEPDHTREYAGQETLFCRIADAASSARLTVVVDTRQARVHDIFFE